MSSALDNAQVQGRRRVQGIEEKAAQRRVDDGG